MPTVWVIDNYDSFVFNLVRSFRELKCNVRVFRNDKVDFACLESSPPDAIVISPGPQSPKEAGSSNDLIRNYHHKIPILGVCLGHQCIGYVWGAKIKPSIPPTHGKTSLMNHDGTGLFQGLPTPFRVTRYHSLTVDPSTLPSDLRITASLPQTGEIMGIAHVASSLFGVQFHPEALLTEYGQNILKNFVSLA